MIKNQASQSISAALINRTDGTAVTTGTTTVYVTIDGGTQYLGTGTVDNEGNGQWTYHPTQADTNGDSIAFLFVNSLAIAVNLQVYTKTSLTAEEEAAVGVQDYDLLSIGELKTFPALSKVPSSENSILQALITAASLDFESYWDNYGVQRTATDIITYRQIIADSKDGDLIYLSKYPIVSVTSITDPASNTIDEDDYWIDANKGILRTTGGWQIPQDDNGFATYWTIIYTAGRVASTGLVPANIKAACKMWVASLYKRADRDLISKSVGDLSLTYAKGSNDDLPATIKRMISAWKKIEI